MSKDKQSFDILVVVPHPDDESALCGGLITRAVEQSVNIRVVFVTTGTHGRTLGLVPQSGLAAERRKEAKLATAALGLKQACFMDYHDFDPRREKKFDWPGAKKRLLSRAGKISKTTIIVGFPPNGINGHPDHVHCSRLASELAEEAGAPLLYMTMGEVEAPYTMDVGWFMKAAQRQKLYVAPTHVMQLTPAEKGRKLWALSHYRTQAISVVDFIRRAEGNLFEEYFTLAGKAPEAAQFLSRRLKLNKA